MGVKRSRSVVGLRGLAIWAVALLLAVGSLLPVGACLAGSWPWAMGPKGSLGTVALVISPGIQRPPGIGPVARRLTLYACGEPGCKDDPALTLDLKAPLSQPGGRPLTTGPRRRFLALDLPPGSYRLAEVVSSLDQEVGPLDFLIKTHFIFDVREGRTTYLGRLTLTPLDVEAQLIWPMERRGWIVTGRSTPGGSRRQVVHLAVGDFLSTDGPALLRNFPEKAFFSFTTELMLWMKK